MTTLFFAGSTPIANSASPVGNGACHAPLFPGSGEFCTAKNDASGPVADWTGDNIINVFNDWRYAADPNDSPNDDGEFATNGDLDAQLLYEDPNRTGPVSCFERHYVDSNMLGREDNDSSLSQGASTGSC